MKNIFRRRITALLIIFIFALAGCVSFLEPLNVKAAEPERKVVRVGYFEVNNMMEGASEDEGKYGFAYDYILPTGIMNMYMVTGILLLISCTMAKLI